MSEPVTFLDALVEALRKAGAYNKDDQSPPAVVLWTDKERQWDKLIPSLRERLPLLTFGAYKPDERTGPAIWLRCVVDGALAEPALVAGQTPVIYLPGVSRQELRDVQDCPKPLQPLAELQYRGVCWTQKNGRDWTVLAFLESKDAGVGVQVAGDAEAREALRRALPKLADELVDGLRKRAPLSAGFLNALLAPDEVKRILLWLNDPSGYRKRQTDDEWQAFRALCRHNYTLDPEKGGYLTGGELLGNRLGKWQGVWDRFSEAPADYPHIEEVLRQARPRQNQLAFFEASSAWPQDNESREDALREELQALEARAASRARQDLLALESEHGARREWVWARLGKAPLAKALEHLAAMSQATQQPLAAGSVGEVAEAYASGGWRADAAVLGALAEVEALQDVAAVRAAIRSIYQPWLEGAADALQQAVSAGGGAYSSLPPGVAEKGTCQLFTDGLRYDLGVWLAARLAKRGCDCQVSWRLAALPTITATARPAASPVAESLTGVGATELTPLVASPRGQFTGDSFKYLLSKAGYQLLAEGDVGDPNGRGWTELGKIDSYGHQHGWRIARHGQEVLREVENRIVALLEFGWARVVVTTDHGWLMLPGGLPKATIPEHLTTVRKGRCARLKPGAQADCLTVPWFWDPEVTFAVAPGIHCFEAGKEYEHGGISPQECVLPLITVTRPSALAALAIDKIGWVNLLCGVHVLGAPSGARVDLRKQPANPGTSLVSAPRPLGADGKASLVVEDADQDGTKAYIVILGDDGAVRAQAETIIGG